jgi:hypothetical protein
MRPRGKFGDLMNLLKTFFKVIAGLIALVIVMIVGLIAALRAQHSMSLTLPAPTGPFAVGRSSFDWVDANRADILAPTPGTKRELAVWIWYPASKNATTGTNEYVPPVLQAAFVQRNRSIFSSLLKRDVARVHSASITNAEIARNQMSYPVLLMKSGVGAGSVDYTTLAEDLASHGYIVVGNDSPYSTGLTVFPEGRAITRDAAGNPGEDAPESVWQKAIGPMLATWTADTKFELDQLQRMNDSPGRFAGRLNLQEVGVFGHSFGGATAAEFCHEDDRCKAGIDMDGQPFGGVVQTGVSQPFMLLMSDHSNETGPETKVIFAHLHSLYDHLPPLNRLWITLRGSRHFNFSDDALTFNWPLAQLSGGTGPIGGRRGLAVAVGCIRSFFDVHLKGAPVTQLDDLPARYSEIQVEH